MRSLHPNRLHPVFCPNHPRMMPHTASTDLMTFRRIDCIFRNLLLLAFVLATLSTAHAYSVLSHEEVVDMAWPQYLLPLLQQRYPGLTPEQITECHAFAYGGSVIQDIGYYPFGDHEFSNLLHYGPQRGLRRGPAARCFHPGRVRLRPRFARPLLWRHHRSSLRQRHHRRRVSQAGKPLWPHRHLRRQRNRPPAYRVRLRCCRGRAWCLLAGELPRLYRLSGGETTSQPCL